MGRAYARDKNCSARLCAKIAGVGRGGGGGGGGVVCEREAYLWGTTVIQSIVFP